MRLYLSSFRMGDRFGELMRALGPRAKVAVISNAVDFIPAEDRTAHARTVFDPVQHFNGQGLDAFDLDLRTFFGDPARLEATLDGVRLVWANGGNAFLLRRAMRQSGLDALLRREVSGGGLVYGGWSAGAVVAAPTLRGLELMDDPEVVVAGYDPEPVWEGLGLVPFSLVPHFGSQHPEAEAAAQAAAWLAAQGLPHRTLRDGEVLVI
ncbi:Type 1 glutamine amidotransferase-like domain-containing protein [Phenylobacterium sp.]|uniref:Type 1 glutamine amidotransferase-like domain-containing protein n=1 Tax=Phenylobacterium sp. TaxID=1871053 RepID=UPI002C8F476F|nr:Type 1 glutamine amidotransferase-like domain-containing protein [Phenylobacterium sp.]HVI32630.1 Type 1 glutamine amidotransferase-like domain-containing protein [Phenylobacterium sp.]